MPIRRPGLLLLWTIMAIGSTFCRADVSPNIVAQGKHATALVEIGGGRAFGSAFCIDPSGFFVTNAHVVNALGNTNLALILNPGETNQQRLEATVARVNMGLDPALLRVQTRTGLTPLVLGSTRDLVETAAVTAFGYPFGKDLAIEENAYPSTMVSTGHITSLHKTKGERCWVSDNTGGQPVRKPYSRTQQTAEWVRCSPLSGLRFLIHFFACFLKEVV